MQIIFYTNTSDERVLNKNLTNQKTYECILKEGCNYIEPAIRLNIQDGFNITNYNYCYIPSFKRYYFINDIKQFRNDLLDVKLSTDVLMSYREYIKQSSGFVTRSQIGNPNLDDARQALLSNRIVETINLPYDLGDKYGIHYILVTAG